MAKFGIDSNMVFDADGKSVATRLSDHDTSLDSLSSSLADIATNVKSYWVNGYANWTPAFTAAFDYLRSVGGGKVLVPKGIYEAVIKVPSYCGIEGTGAQSIIKLPANSTESCIQLYDENTIMTTFRDFTIDGNKANQTSKNAKGMYLYSTQGVARDPHAEYFDYRGNSTVIENVFVNKCYGVGAHYSFPGPVFADWLNIDGCDDDGIVIEVPDSHFNNVASGENFGHGIVVKAGNTRLVNCKGWNNGIGNTGKTAGYGIYLYGCDNVYVQGESQGNLLDGVFMESARMCTVDVFSDANGKRDAIVSNGVSGFTLKNCVYNTVRGSVKGRPDRGETLQNYAVSLLATCARNIIDITGDSLTVGALYDETNNLLLNDVRVNVSITGGSNTQVTTKMNTTTKDLSSCTTWGQVNSFLPNPSVTVVEPQQIATLLPSGTSGQLFWGTVKIHKFSGGRMSAEVTSNDGAVVTYSGTYNNTSGTMDWVKTSGKLNKLNNDLSAVTTWGAVQALMTEGDIIVTMPSKMNNALLPKTGLSYGNATITSGSGGRISCIITAILGSALVMYVGTYNNSNATMVWQQASLTNVV
jgi:hypothetical protein